jgi:hypothetical protein
LTKYGNFILCYLYEQPKSLIDILLMIDHRKAMINNLNQVNLVLILSYSLVLRLNENKLNRRLKNWRLSDTSECKDNLNVKYA